MLGAICAAVNTWCLCVQLQEGRTEEDPWKGWPAVLEECRSGLQNPQGGH